MLRYIFYFFLGLIFLTSLHAKEEISIIQDLIARSERQLTIQKFLKELIVDLEQQEELFIHGKCTKQQVNYMVETAHQILILIEENHYTQFFPAIYLEELRLFSKIAQKNNPKASSS